MLLGSSYAEAELKDPRRNELLAASRRVLDGAHVSLHPGDARDRVRLVMTDEMPWTGMVSRSTRRWSVRHWAGARRVVRKPLTSF